MPIEFHWIVPGRLAGCGQPGLMGSLDDDLAWIEWVGIRTIVTLTEGPMQLDDRQRNALRWVHFPIDDMGIPTPRRAAAIVQDVIESISRSEPVALHCKAGLGRTGTMLACCLVALGQDPSECILAIRRICPNYIQRQRQERFIHDFARFMANATSDDLRPWDLGAEQPVLR